MLHPAPHFVSWCLSCSIPHTSGWDLRHLTGTTAIDRKKAMAKAIGSVTSFAKAGAEPCTRGHPRKFHPLFLRGGRVAPFHSVLGHSWVKRHFINFGHSARCSLQRPPSLCACPSAVIECQSHPRMLFFSIHPRPPPFFVFILNRAWCNKGQLSCAPGRGLRARRGRDPTAERWMAGLASPPGFTTWPTSAGQRCRAGGRRSRDEARELKPWASTWAHARVRALRALRSPGGVETGLRRGSGWPAGGLQRAYCVQLCKEQN